MADEVETVELAAELLRLGVAKTADVATAAQGEKAETAIQQAALDAAIATRATAAQGAKADAALAASEVGLSVAQLVAGKVPSAQLPSYVDDVLEFANVAAFPATGEVGKIYVRLDTDIDSQYRWSGSAYVRMVSSPGTTDTVQEGAVNKYFSAALVRVVTLANLTLTNAAIVAGDAYELMFGKLQAQITAAKQSVTDLADSVGTSLSNKVDKAAGKGLSTNDYDAAAVAVVASVAGIGTNAAKGLKAKLEVALGDEVTALTTGTKLTMHVAEAMTLTEVFGGLSVAQTGGTLLTFDIKKNGASIFSTKPVFNNAGETTIAATTPGTLAGTVALAKGDKLVFSIDAVGDGTAKGLKVYLLGTR